MCTAKALAAVAALVMTFVAGCATNVEDDIAAANVQTNEPAPPINPFLEPGQFGVQNEIRKEAEHRCLLVPTDPLVREATTFIDYRAHDWTTEDIVKLFGPVAVERPAYCR